MFLSDLSIKRPVMMTMVILVLAVIGVYSLLDLGLDMFPKIEFPFVSVMTIYPGAGPEEVETLISKPIEEEVGAINGVKSVQSVSQEGLSFVFIEFQLEKNVDIAGIDVKEKIDAIRYKLPDDIETPAISKFDMSSIPIMNLAVSSPRPLDEVYRITDKEIKQELGKIQGLANIGLVGGKIREIRIEADKNALASRGLSLTNLIMAIQYENLNVPSGHIVEGRKEFSIRMAGEFSSVEEIRNIKIPVPNGSPIKISEVAKVSDDFKEQRELARFNKETSVGISLVKRSDANTVEVANAVKDALEKMKTTLPKDIRIDIARDGSTFIQNSVADVTGNIVTGILLTSLVLMVFLQNWKGTIIAALSMPLSVISTFTLLRFAGFTLNTMSLMGLAISVGVLVANSIVVLENIERYKALGKPVKEAAAIGTSEIALAVAASTLTNIVVFTPIAFMSGIIGMFFREFGLTVTFATLVSLLISFTLVPMMASMRISGGVYAFIGIIVVIMTYVSMGLLTTIILIVSLALFLIFEKIGVKDKAIAKWENFYKRLEAYYRRTLKWSISHRKTILLSIAVLFFLSLPLVAFIGSEFMTPSDQGSFSISLEMPAGSSVEQTDAALNYIEAVVEKEPEIKSMYTALGTSESGDMSFSSGVNLGVVVIQLVDAKERNVSTDEFITRLRPKMTGIPSAKITMAPVSMFGGGGGDIQIEVQGPDITDLNKLAEQVADICRQTPGLVDVGTSNKIGKPELYITPRRNEISELGLTSGQVALGLRQMIEGEVAGKYREAGDEYDIRVRLSERDRSHLSKVGDYLIPTYSGAVPLARVADIKYAEGPTTISRKNKQRLIMVTANTANITIGQAQSAIETKLKEINIKPGYTVFFGGMNEHMGEAFFELFKALILASILTYMLMAAMMESYKNPFIIMMTLPLALIGVIISLLLTGKTISIFSLMAVVMLVGIVVNNGILLIDYMTVLRKEQNFSLREAILEACPIRLRPIIMTNLAAILGMIPLAMGLGAGGEMRSSMAVVSIGGFITSTIFTLYLVPVLYASFEGIKKLEKQGKPS